MLMSHTSGTGDAFGFPASARRAAVRLERAPYAGFEYSGGAVIIQQLALADAVGKPFAQITPVGVGPFAVGFDISKQGEGWYFGHAGSNWGFQCDLVAHRLKGYGAVIMTNGDGGGALMQQLRRMIQREYQWDALDAPVPRRYGPQ